jgi:predicted Zn-ribbon and HTH transcriptional regulator
MATLREKVAAAIAQQESEVDRLVAVAKVALRNARAVLHQLQAIASQLDKNADLEDSYATLRWRGHSTTRQTTPTRKPKRKGKT